ncbi:MULTISPECIES: terminase [unclassified Sphingomonas]|uniref:terminase n=1 Tax=Novosphingobium rhizosphaerae TaxID=1551649 RepID=UPI0015CA7C42
MARNAKAELAADVGSFTHDPLGHALYVYPWGQGELVGIDGPRRWQREVMIEIRDHLANPATRYTPLRIARASGHGIGKSATISMLVKWALDTCPDTRVVVTANTEAQLLTKTSPELTKWQNLALTRDWFRVSATSITSNQPGHEKQWRADLVTWSEHNTEAFAGLHNQGRRIVLIFDEASGIADKVWEVALGALTDADTEIIWLAFGNPTLNTGAFRECFGKHRNLWRTAQIDSRTVEGTNKTYLQELCDTYGEDSDIAKVRVRGMFPSASSMQFIALSDVEVAQSRDIPAGLPGDPIVFGVDCARFGDDESVLAIRRGRDARSLPWKSWGQVDAMTLAGDIALEAARYHPDAIFVDAGNIGAAVVDRLRQLIPDTPVIEVWFGGKGRDAELEPGVTVPTADKRAEMWTRMRSWLRSGAIPDRERLRDDLIGPTYAFAADDTRVKLERKPDMKKRGLPSPDWGDALACTFAEPVMPRAVPGYLDPDNYGARDRYEEL